MRATKPKREEKRQKILEAAGRVFHRAGLQGASISAICSEAGISPGHLYHYFDSKEAILEAITEAFLADAEEHYEKQAASVGVIPTLGAEIEKTIRYAATGGQALFFELIAEAGRNPRLASMLRDSASRRGSLLSDIIRKGQERGEIDAGLEPEAVAFLIINVLDAAKMMTTRDPGIDIAKNVGLMSTMLARFLATDPDRETSPER